MTINPILLYVVGLVSFSLGVLVASAGPAGGARSMEGICAASTPGWHCLCDSDGHVQCWADDWPRGGR